MILVLTDRFLGWELSDVANDWEEADRIIEFVLDNLRHDGETGGIEFDEDFAYQLYDPSTHEYRTLYVHLEPKPGYELHTAWDDE